MLAATWLVGLIAAAPLAPAPVTAGAPPAAAAPSGAQARYDAAQAAFDRGDWKAAVTGFQTLTPRDPALPLSRSQAVIAGRTAYALWRMGRLAPARTAAARAAAALDADTPEGDEARLVLADVAADLHDEHAAAEVYRAVRDAAVRRGDAATLARARLGLGSVLISADPRAAIAELDAWLAAAGSATTPDARLGLAVVQDRRGRAALNAGDLADGQRWIDRAVATSGGLTLSKVSVPQATMRIDAAIASSLRHDDELTRKYLTYMGAGHLANPGWIGHYEGELPVCGDAGVEPGDVVVVQLAVDDRGAVAGVAPLYASRPGELGAVFARAVAGWRWEPDSLKGVDAYWRNTLALQLSCQSRPKPDGLGRDTEEAVTAWLASRGVEGASEDFKSFIAADDPRLARDDLAAAPAQFGRTWRDKEAAAAAARLRAILDANAAPAPAYALLLWKEAVAAGAAPGLRERARRRADALAQGLPGLERRFPDDPAIAWLRLEQALALEDAGTFPAAAPLLARVTATPAAVLPQDSPVRRVALLHAGVVGRLSGNADAAQAQLAASGVSEHQCLLFDTHPVPTSMAASSTAFPDEAQRWRFEGYVREAFDISDDGRVVHPRAVVAYPPFVFGEGTGRVVNGFRYVPPRLGSTAVGCTGQTVNVNFRLPK